MELAYYGHSCFSAKAGRKTLLFDPFITPNPLASHFRGKEISSFPLDQ
jgi:L-ascorbate metabolism protein UlaG (beta-lactamase superfamily)